MGPRLCRRGNYPGCTIPNASSPCFNGATPLQTWKHSIARMDRSNPILASMGPRLCRRGNAEPSCIRIPELCRFNGATPLQTWKPRRTVASLFWPNPLQWGHAFADVETWSQPPARLDFPQLQWGHAFADVETELGSFFFVQPFSASMGPRLCRRGNRRSGNAGGCPGELQWGHAFADVETRQTRASSFIARRLQWGHAFADVETH